MIINTLEDAKAHDEVLRHITEIHKSVQLIHDKVSDLPLHHLTTIIKKLKNDGYVTQAHYPGRQQIFAITDVGKVFLERGGYEMQFKISSKRGIDTGTASRDKKRLLFEAITVLLTLALVILGIATFKSSNQAAYYKEQRDSLSNVVIELKRQRDSLTALINSRPTNITAAAKVPKVICYFNTSIDQFGTIRYTYEFENIGNKEATELRAVVKALSPDQGAVEFGHGNWSRSNTNEAEGIQFWNFVYDHPLGIAEKATIIVAIGAEYINRNQEKGLPVMEARHLGAVIKVQKR